MQDAIDTSHPHQRGISLISLLIGMLLAMLALLAMLMLFRTVVHNSAEAGRDSRQNGDRSLALLMAHQHLHDAGYGLPAPTFATDLQPCNATLDPDTGALPDCTAAAGASPWTVNTLLWRFDSDRDGTQPPVCAGLHSSEQGFYYLMPVSCETSGWPTSWQPQWLLSDIDGQAPLELKVEKHATAAGACQALGAAGSGGVSVTLRGQHTGSGTALESSTCLVNFPPQ